MPLEFSLAFALGSVLTVLTLLSQAALWQRKEYRLDRMRAFVLSPEWRYSYGWLYIIVAILSNAGWAAYFLDLNWSSMIGFSELLAFFFFHAHRLATRGLYRPRFTQKNLLLLGTMSAGVIGCLFFTLRNTQTAALQWSTLIFLLPVWAALCVEIVNEVTDIRKRQIIAGAADWRRRLKRLQVVGITGSYGKTSTKYFLDQILEQAQVPHLVTDEHRNSDLAVAEDMLQRLTTKHHVYVAEMGAYAAGEIAALVQLTRPSIGIITAIGNQHIALFGNLEALAKAKWELVDGLASNGTAILNADDPVIQKEARAFPGRKLWYSSRQPSQVFAENIVIEPSAFRATFHFGDFVQSIIVPLASDAMLSSVLAAAAGALVLKVKPEKIAAALSSLKPAPRTMEVMPGRHGSVVIDDSYSANEAGVLAALRHLQRFPEPHKIVVLAPLIELDQEAPAVHERIGRALRSLGADVYIFGPSHTDDLRRGWQAAKSGHLQFISRPADLAHTLSDLTKTGTVILLEGRLPDVVRNAVRQTR